MTAPTMLCLASYFKGHRFLEEAKHAGSTVYLLTVEKLLKEAWPRQAIDEVYAVPDFADRKKLIHAVAYLMRTKRIDLIVALDDFDVEVAGCLRDHFRFPGHGDSTARFFRDKLAMRAKAKEIGVRIPEFTRISHHADVTAFLDRVPGPWLVKPRGEASAAGIRKCQTKDEVWARIHELGDEQSYHLVEEMVPGDLFHVDSLCENGKVIFAEVNAYWRPLLDVYQGGGVYATRTLRRDSADVKALQTINAKLLEGFGLGNGASHTEFMKAHRDGEFYFIETSCRVGGAETATMVEAATGVNLWGEWAKLEVARTVPGYKLPPQKARYGGVVISLANSEHPDTSAFSDPEILHRLNMKNHIGFVLVSDSPDRIETLLTQYIERIRQHHHAILPAADSVAH
ncbi:MAG: ATP-grasp domain-containing protein [Fimbriiglobus sp.]